MASKNSRRNQVLSTERAAVVKEFLSLEHRTAAAATEHAERLGISRSNFYRLARAYDESVGELSVHGSTGIGRLDDETERQISRVLDRTGVQGRVSDAFVLVDRACRSLGLATPAREVVRRRMVDRRRDMPVDLVGPPLRFDETGLGMGVVVGGDAVLPAMSMILHAPTGRVMVHRLDPGPDRQSSFRLSHALGLPEATPLGTPRLKGGYASSVFGDRLGPFLLRPRAAGRPPAKHYRFEIGLEEARRMVGRLVDEHNATRPHV